jgi:tartrate-resistant acid phosphatase type 5
VFPFLICPPTRRDARSVACALVVCAVLAGCNRRVSEPRASAAAAVTVAQNGTLPVASTQAPPVAPPPPAASAERLRFAVIGDYGMAGEPERRVAELVKGYAPEIVVTTGDNNYPLGSAASIDDNIGQFYAEFIGSYRGKYGKGAAENRFFPSLGNHDWYSELARPYLDYFSLPGNERYYAFARGPVEFFALDSDAHEPDGNGATGRQATWLKERAQASKATWRIAYMHHPPYSSGPHGSALESEWPYKDWGIDLVLAGHDHTYERARLGGVTYLVNGLGGAQEYEFKAAIDGSEFRYNAKHGAQLAEATKDELRLTFVNVDGERIDEVVLKR